MGIQKQDLRIGNLIRYTNDEDLNTSLRGTSLVVDIDTLTYIEIGDRPDFYEPIPLTPEILEKCGYQLWENEESVNKYTEHLKKLISNE